MRNKLRILIITPIIIINYTDFNGKRAEETGLDGCRYRAQDDRQTDGEAVTKDGTTREKRTQEDCRCKINIFYLKFLSRL
jgi:hypothetical protein